MAHNFIYDLLLEIFVPSLDTIGASIRWIFTRKNRTFKEICKLKNNGWIGFIFTVLVFALLLYLLNY